MKLAITLGAMIVAVSCVFGRGESGLFIDARARRRAFTGEFMAVVLEDPKKPGESAKADPHAPVCAMATLYTQKDLPGGNQRMNARTLR